MKDLIFYKKDLILRMNHDLYKQDFYNDPYNYENLNENYQKLYQFEINHLIHNQYHHLIL